MSAAKLKKNILGSILYRESKLDCRRSLNVSSQRLNMAPRWSLGRQMMVCTELKMVTAALGDQEGTAVFSVVPLTLYERSQKHLGAGSTGGLRARNIRKRHCPPKLQRKLMDHVATKRIASVKRAKQHAICSVFGHDHSFPPCLLELLCSQSKQSRQQLHLLFSAIILILKSDTDTLVMFASYLSF